MRGREVYVAKVARLPFVSVKVGVLSTKFHEAAKRVREIDIPRLEAESGLKIMAELPPNTSSYSGLSAQDLALIMLEGLLKKSGVRPKHIDVLRLGSVIAHKTDERNWHAFAKVVALRAEMKQVYDAFTEDDACSSGLKAIGLAYNAVAHEGADFAIGGGVEKMCDVPDRLVRFGLTNPFDGRLMAALADEVAKDYGLTREELDDYAFESCERARAWQGKHRFIIPVRRLTDGAFVERDEEVENRPKDRRVFARAPLYPQYADRADSPKCDRVTVANSGQYASGGGIVLLASKKGMKLLKLTAMAKILAFAETGESEPKNFIFRPGEAINEVLGKCELGWEDLDHIENNEAFVVGSVLLMKKHNLHRDKINSRGGATAHGHAIGGTGGSLVVKQVDQMNAEGMKRAAVSVCHAVDGATAMLFENPRA